MINCSRMICTCRAFACSLAFCSSFSFWVSWERKMAHASSLSQLHSNVEDKQQCLVTLVIVLWQWRGDNLLSKDEEERTEDWMAATVQREIFTGVNFTKMLYSHQNTFSLFFPSLAWMQTWPCLVLRLLALPFMSRN